MQKSQPRLLLVAGLSAVGAVLCPAGVGVAVAHPAANFDWTPKPVVAGQPVTFQSTSVPHDLSTPITRFAWNLDGKGACSEADLLGSPTCTTTAPPSGDWNVSLLVEDIQSESTSITKTIPVQPPPSPPNEAPTAAFAALPASPLVGEEVTFVSYSEDRDGRITSQAWDLDGNGTFDDASGAVAKRRFSTPGSRTVTLRVRDDRGAGSSLSLTVLVRAQADGSQAGASPPAGRRPLSGPTPLPRLLSPFPIVRLVGSAGWTGTNIELLAVRAPMGSRALVRCRGQGCPVTRIKQTVRRAPLRLKAVETTMPAGVVLEVLVRRGNRIGKFTRFRFRRSRRPLRTDGCLWPGTTKMAPCPKS
jgi:hypothetical protein